MRFAIAIVVAITAAVDITSAFAPAAARHHLNSNSLGAGFMLMKRPASPSFDFHLQASASSSSTMDAQATIDSAISEAGSNGVTLFGKSACPFCKKAKKALLGIGIHATIVELDQVEGGPAIQKKLEELTGKSTVPNVWLDGKFIGGSEEVLKGVDDGMFDAVEKGEIIVMEDEEKIPIVQGPDALKVGDKVPDAKVWAGFASDDFVSLADYGKDKNILVVGLPGAFTPT